MIEQNKTSMKLQLNPRLTEFTELEKELISCISYIYKPIENAINKMIDEKIIPNDLKKTLIKDLKLLNVFEKFIPNVLKREMLKRDIYKINFKLEDTEFYKIILDIKRELNNV